MDITGADNDAIVRTVMGEAGTESPEGKAAVTHVILNRINSGDYGSSASKIVKAPGQFEPWQTRSRELMSYDPKSPDYKATKAIVDDVLAGKIDDPTGGATHFLAPDVMRARGTPAPEWAQGKPIAQIGGHQFFAPNGPATPDLLGSLAKSYNAPAATSAAPANHDDDLLGNLARSYETPVPGAATPANARRAIIQAPWSRKATDESPAGGNFGYMGPAVEPMGNAVGGLAHGVMEVANTGAQGIGYLTNHVTKFLADRGIMSPEDVSTAKNRSAVLDQRIAQENQAYEKKYGDSNVAYGGQIAGNMLASAPLLMSGEGALAAGANAATRYSPQIAQLAAKYGPSALVRLGLVAPVQGGLGGAEIAGATSSGNNAPLGQQIIEGAKTGFEFGPLGPAVEGAGRYVGNALKAVVSPFTEAGRARLANNFIGDRGGNALNVRAHEIVPGSTPTLAEATGDANIATVQRSMRDLNPAPFVAQEAKNSQARSDLLTRVAGTPQDVDAAKASLAAQANHAVGSLFKPGQVVDAAPVVAEIDGILNGAGGKRDAVKSVLGNIRSKLVDAKTGALESDPEYLYQSVRKQIGDFLDKNGDTKAGLQASRELQQVRDVLDERITKAVPGFDKYLSDYSAASKPIDAAKYLQGLRLTDAQGNITLAKVQSALQGIAKQRQAAGINPAKSLTQSHIDALESIRDDLLRQADIGKGRSVGSNTVQNIATQNLLGGVLGNRLGGLVGHINPGVLGSGIGAAVGSLMGPWGAAGGAGTGTLLGHLAGEAIKGKNALVQHQLEEILINPHKFSPSPQRGQNLPVNRLQFLPPAVVAARHNALAAPAGNNTP